MAKFFDVTPVTTSISLDEAKRTGQGAFTVTNATGASIRGDAVVVPQPGSEQAKYEVERPSRRFDAGASDQFTVTVTVPDEVKAGTYGFQLRMLLGGGVPEEQYDDSTIVHYDVTDKPPPPPPPPPPKKGIPWWVFLIIGIVVLAVIGGIVAFILTRPQPTSLTLEVSMKNDNGGSATAAEWTVKADGPTTFSGPGTTKSPAGFQPGEYTLSQTGGASGYTASPWDCHGTKQTGSKVTLDAGQTALCTIVLDDQLSQLKVVSVVMNNDGVSSAVPGDFLMHVTGTAPTPANFAGSAPPGTTVTIGSGTFDVKEDLPTGKGLYLVTLTGECSGVMAPGQTKSCTVVNDDFFFWIPIDLEPIEINVRTQ
jgi:hypothetical protein